MIALLIAYLILAVFFFSVYRITQNKVYGKLSVFWLSSAFFEMLSICPPPQDPAAEIVLKGICIVCSFVLLYLITKDLKQQAVQSKLQKKREE